MPSGNSNQPAKAESSSIFRKKDPEKLIQASKAGDQSLKKSLTGFDLTVLGLGAIIGAGIFTLSGTAAAGSAGHIGAGPALILSFVISGTLCAIAALSYAELAAMIPVAGSAYTYTYATLGEVIAWLTGWILLLEYGIGCITVACGWSGYLFKLLEGFHQFLPDWLINPPYWLTHEYHAALHLYEQAGMTPYFPEILGIPISVNLPAIFIIALMTLFLYIGIQESARIAAIMVIIKVAVILGFILVGAWYVDPANWTPFMPNGFPGVFMGAFLVFFAYIGFDSVATAAEETKNPAKDLPIGILTSLGICTIIYILVAAVLTGMVYYKDIDVHAPIAAAMQSTGTWFGNTVAGTISLGAVAGLSSVILVELLAVSRILFAMSRDGLLPKILSKVHKKFKTPHVITIVTGSLIAIGTLFLDINKAAELCNVGTLTAFAMVCIGVIILRYTEPDRPRPFRAPFVPILPAFGAICCIALILYTFFNPETPLILTLILFSSWIAIGLITYFLYGRSHSVLRKELEETKPPANNQE
jgi:APA family basic amino acid/polyamine antiporter